MTPSNMKNLKNELYKIVDGFLTEAKDQNGNDRSLERLNQDRHLAVKNLKELITQDRKELLESVLKQLPNKQREYSFDNQYPKCRGYNNCLSEVQKIIKDLIK